MQNEGDFTLIGQSVSFPPLTSCQTPNDVRAGAQFFREEALRENPAWLKSLINCYEISEDFQSKLSVLTVATFF